MKKWDVLGSEYIFQNQFYRLRLDTCLLPNGKIIEQYMVNECPEWVNIVAVTPDGQMVLVRQYRHGSGASSLEIPGGVVEENEDIRCAVTRELREETGYVSENDPLLIGRFYTNPANATNTVSTFLLTGVEKKYDQAMDDTEDIEIVVCPLDEMDGLIARGEITHLFAVTALLLAKNYLESNSPS